MRSSTWNNLLWIVNSLLSIAFIVFAFNYFIFPEPRPTEKVIPDIPEEEGGRTPARQIVPLNSYRHIWALGTTIEYKTPPPPVEVKPVEDPGEYSGPPIHTLLKLDGTTPVLEDPEHASGTAFLEILANKKKKLVMMGDEVEVPDPKEGRTHRPIVIAIHPESIDFKYYNEEVRLERVRKESGGIKPSSKIIGAGEGGDDLPGPETTATDEVHVSDSRPSGAIVNFGSHRDKNDKFTYHIVPDEANWAMNNEEKLLAEVSVRPVAGGGIEIESIQKGSVVAQRGLRGGDRIISVNGIPVNSMAEIQGLKNDPRVKDASVLRVVLERAGRRSTMTYRLKK